MASTRWKQRRIRRRLIGVHSELKKARAAVAIAEEQLVSFVDEAEEARLRSLVSDNTADERNSSAATRHRELMERALESARRRVQGLEMAERDLLAQIEV
jgi:hypothetical protein